jgi:hypothetical protein
MSTRTSILAVGVTLALVAPAAASARAVTNQAGDTYFFTEHSQAGKQSQASRLSKATQTFFFTEHSVGFTSNTAMKATHSTVTNPHVLRAPYGPTGIVGPTTN